MRWGRRLDRGAPVGVLLVVAYAVVVGPLGAQERFEYAEPHMGTEFRVVFYADDRALADSAAAEAFALAALMDSLWSDYRDDSEIAELARRAGTGDALRVHRLTAELLLQSIHYARVSDGAFDPTVGPLTRLWRWSARRGELPDNARLEEARALVGVDRLHVAGSNAVMLAVAGMSLDLGGIAKGYAADRMGDVFTRLGLRRFLIDAGGDVLVGAAPPGRDGWRVVTALGEALHLTNRAVATSGDTERYLEVDGVRYSHIVDPRTGLGVVGAEPVTVVAPTGLEADAFASVASVLGTLPDASRGCVVREDADCR